MAKSRNEYFREYRKQNKEKIREYSKNYMKDKRKKDPEYYERELERNRLRRKQDPEEYIQNRLMEVKEMAEKRGISLEPGYIVKGVSVTGNRVTVTEEPGQSICLSCGGFFKPKRITGKYCSDNCRVNYNRRK